MQRISLESLRVRPPRIQEGQPLVRPVYETSRQVKNAFKRKGGRRISEAEQRRLDRLRELDERAEKIRLKEERKKQNALKRKLKEEKEGGKKAVKLTASQPALSKFFKRASPGLQENSEQENSEEDGLPTVDASTRLLNGNREIDCEQVDFAEPKPVNPMEEEEEVGGPQESTHELSATPSPGNSQHEDSKVPLLELMANPGLNNDRIITNTGHAVNLSQEDGMSITSDQRTKNDRDDDKPNYRPQNEGKYDDQEHKFTTVKANPDSYPRVISDLPECECLPGSSPPYQSSLNLKKTFMDEKPSVIACHKTDIESNLFQNNTEFYPERLSRSISPRLASTNCQSQCLRNPTSASDTSNKPAIPDQADNLLSEWDFETLTKLDQIEKEAEAAITRREEDSRILELLREETDYNDIDDDYDLKDNPTFEYAEGATSPVPGGCNDNNGDYGDNEARITASQMVYGMGLSDPAFDDLEAEQNDINLESPQLASDTESSGNAISPPGFILGSSFLYQELEEDLKELE